MKKDLQGVKRYNRYNEHMDCIKGCLDYLGIDLSFPWLYGGTGQAFVLNMNAQTNVDAAHGWDIDTLFNLGPNLGWRVERLFVDHETALQLLPETLREAQRAAWDFVRAKINNNTPCYGWELSPIPNYNAIKGYAVADDNPDAPGDYIYLGYFGEDTCPWDKLGSFDVLSVHVLSVEPCDPAPAAKVVKDALQSVLDRIEKPDGWANRGNYTSGLPAYEVWAEALESGTALRDAHSYLNQVWLECREHAVAFLEEVQQRLPGLADNAVKAASTQYTKVCDNLRSLYTLFPDREQQDWVTMFGSKAGAALVRTAWEAEKIAVDNLSQVVARM